MLDPETLERLEKAIDRVKEKSAEGVAIVVEGKNDEKALRKLGIEGPIHRVPEGDKTLLNTLEGLPDYDEAIVLTDFDRTGEKMASFCRKHMEKLGTKVLYEFRNKIRHYLRKGVKDIEGISSFLRKERSSGKKNDFRLSNDFV